MTVDGQTYEPLQRLFLLLPVLVKARYHFKYLDDFRQYEREAMENNRVL